MDEAKSKLKDPGLVYSYHGQGRKRVPTVLAKNSIVVTTYETLASDANFHRKKSSEGDQYVPPCEQVRWWRVICDESHSIRNGSIKASAVTSLVADNKWLVSGEFASVLAFSGEHLHYCGVLILIHSFVRFLTTQEPRSIPRCRIWTHSSRSLVS